MECTFKIVKYCTAANVVLALLDDSHTEISTVLKLVFPKEVRIIFKSKYVD